MFEKLLKKKDPSEKVGGLAANDLDTYITIADEYQIKLEKKITIGREIGDLIIDEESISPRHCTFYLNQGVVSVIDHSSQAGTFINKKKIAPGRVFILNEKDKLKLGSLKTEIELLEPEPMVDTPIESEGEVNEETFTEIAPLETPKEDQTDEIKNYFEDDTNQLDTQDLEMEIPATPTQDLAQEEMDDIDITDINVEEEDLDVDILPIAVRQAHEVMVEARRVEESEEEEEVLFETEGSPDIGKLEDDLKETGSSKVIKASKRPKNKKLKVKNATEASSSFLTRFFSVINDIIFCKIILEIFLVYTDFKAFYETFYSDIWNFVAKDFNTQIKPAYLEFAKDFAFIGDLVGYVTTHEYTLPVLKFFVFYLVYRSVCGLIFSLSLGQFLVGIYNKGNFVLKRLVYPIREFIGLVLMPFVIFDLPALFGKRSFKEVVTGTQLITPRPKMTVFSALVLTPLLAVVMCISPYFKGVDILKSIPVDYQPQAEKLVKFKKPVLVSSMGFIYDEDSDIKLIPNLSLIIKKKKKVLSAGAFIIDMKTGLSIEVRKLKSFNLIDLYTGFVNNNLLSEFFQPQIHSTAKNVALNNKDFKFKIENPDELSLETQKLIRDIYKLNIETFIGFAMNNGVLLGGFRDFREKLDNLFEDEFQKVLLKNIGNNPSVIAYFDKGKNSHYDFIPLGMEKGAVFRLEGNINSIKSKKILKNLYFAESISVRTKLKKGNGVVAFVNAFNEGRKVDDANMLQYLYEEYFNISKGLLGRALPTKNVEKSLRQLIQHFEKSPRKNKIIMQKLSQILEALKDKKYKFFGVKNENVKTV